MPNLTSVGIINGVPKIGTGDVSTIDALMADGGQATLGAKADAKSTATDVTPVTAMSVWKQISASVQSLVVGTVLAAGSAIIGKVDHTTTGIGHGSKNVTTAGTDVVLAASTAAKWVTIQARRSNTANIAVGAAGVDATAATGDGVTLAAGETITIPVDNLADVFIDATVNGEGVRYTYGT